LTHAALHGAQRFDEAVEAFQIMLSKFDDTIETQIRREPRITHALTCLTLPPERCQQYLSPSEAERTIRKVIDAQLEKAPLHVLDNTTGVRLLLICHFIPLTTRIEGFSKSGFSFV